MRSRLQTDERRGQLLALGLQLFGTRAYDEVSIDDIADAAGVSKGLLYHYFGGKRAFYVATVSFAAARLLGAIDDAIAAVPRGADLATHARVGVDAYLTFVQAHADVYFAFESGGLGADPEVAKILEDTRASIIGRVASGLGLTETRADGTEGDAAGVERPVFRTALRSWIGAVEAAAAHWFDRRDVSRDDLVGLLARLLADTIAAAARLDPRGAAAIAQALGKGGAGTDGPS